MKTTGRLRRACIGAVIASTVIPVGTQVTEAGIYNSSTAVTYKEYWVSHVDWTGGCPEHGLYHPEGNQFYLEPSPCAKSSTFVIPDNVQQAIKVEIYVDLWRAARNDVPGINFKLNNGPTRLMNRGADWSRTAFLMDIPKSEVNQGSNTITFTGTRGHVHDVALRVYHDAAHPLVPGGGSDVTPPTNVSLTEVSATNGAFAPGAGGTLQVDNNVVGLKATANGAARVEFIGFYEGYDEDNDGQITDWHVFNRNNWNPGGKFAVPNGGTIGHFGTDATSPYAVNGDLRIVKNQTGVKFKVRAVDAAGNVVETAASAPFELARSYNVSVFRIPDFQDAGIHQNGAFPDQITRTIQLPASVGGVTAAFIAGNYWQNPFLSINGKADFKAFNTEDVWTTSIRSIPLNQLVGGANTITYKYNSTQIKFGQFVEDPGPMVVLYGGGASTLPTLSISDVSKVEGNSGSAPITFKVTLSAASTKQVKVRLSTANGTATAPSDFVAKTNVLLSIPAGVTSKNFTVAVKGEKVAEADETFTVNMSAPVNATIADGTGIGTIVDND